MTDQANTTVSDERLAELAQAFKTWVQSGRSGAPDLDRDVADALTELSARRATADVTEATFRDHTETLVELLDIIKEHWVDYDHVYSIAVHEARAALKQQAPE